MKSKLVFARKLVAGCAVTMAASAAHADITVFTDRAAFLTAVSGSATDTFDDLTMTETVGPLMRMAGTYGYRVNAGPSDGGFYPSGSGSDIWLNGTMSSDVITFNAFSPGVLGFGGNFFGTDSFGSFMPGSTVVLSAVSGADSETFTLSNASQGSFVAFLSDGTVYWATANNVVLAVPEPATWSMLVGGLGITALARRRKGRSQQTTTVA